jgi:hypothetical protein
MPAPVSTAVVTEAEQIGHLKLRGQHVTPTTSAYPDLDKNGVGLLSMVLALGVLINS